jgi:hypothetical protein
LGKLQGNSARPAPTIRWGSAELQRYKIDERISGLNFTCVVRIFEMKITPLSVGVALLLVVAGCKSDPSNTSGLPFKERVEEHAPSTPTPTPTKPIYVPLDPTGQPQ